MKTRFMGTFSYGWRLQNDDFLPFTINNAITAGGVGCQTSSACLPSRRSLDGDVRPLTVNATVVNNFFDPLNLKAYYRFYDLDNRSRQLSFPEGIIVNDQVGRTTDGIPANCLDPGGVKCPDAGIKSIPYAYSKNNVGFDASYPFARWLTGKLSYSWERTHRERRDVLNANEHSVGPTIDIKPSPWVLFRASYRHFWRGAPDYNNNRVESEFDDTNLIRKFDLAKRDRDKASFFAQVTPWEQLTLYGAFDFIADEYRDVVLGTQTDLNYSPSVGLIYAPLDWLRFFTDYNWERFDWKLDAMQRSNSAPLEDPTDPTTCDPNCQLRKWTSRGTDRIHTASVGTDITLIEKVLGFRIQYGYSTGASQVRARGANCTACTPATNYADVKNTWHELLARLEYQVHKHVALKVGYYFNRSASNDFGVDIMKPWMGDVDVVPSPNANVQRSIFLGDKVKGPFTAHVGFIALRFSF
jgi:hypothetical protein